MAVIAEKVNTFTVEASRALSARLHDSPRTASLRIEAAGIASLRSWPDSYKERPWKYHDVSRLDLAPYTPPRWTQSTAMPSRRRTVAR